MRKSILASSSAIFGALAAVLAILPISFPYPLIPYLKFDPAELPVALAFLALGPIPGFLSAITYWIILLLVGEFSPIGPTMKFLAVSSMLLGAWAGFKVSKTWRGGLALSMILGGFLRVLVMSISNYLVAVLFFPEFFEIAARMISLSLGIKVLGRFSSILLVLAFTSLFNILHLLMSLIPTLAALRYLLRGGFLPSLGKPWCLAIFERDRV